MGSEIADRVSFMNLKESTLYHLNACEKAKTKASRNYHYAIYTWQKGSKEFVSDKDKVKLWNKLKKIYGDEKCN